MGRQRLTRWSHSSPGPVNECAERADRLAACAEHEDVVAALESGGKAAAFLSPDAGGMRLIDDDESLDQQARPGSPAAHGRHPCCGGFRPRRRRARCRLRCASALCIQEGTDVAMRGELELRASSMGPVMHAARHRTLR